MKLSTGAMAPKLKRILALLAAIAVGAATLASVTAPAGAYSGGTSTGSGDGGSKYDRLWRDTSRHNKRWARHTAQCESGKDPDAIGGGGAYRGAFQFMKSTWNAAPKSPGGDPIDYSYTTQAVVAVALKNQDGAGHWPVCG